MKVLSLLEDALHPVWRMNCRAFVFVMLVSSSVFSSHTVEGCTICGSGYATDAATDPYRSSPEAFAAAQAENRVEQTFRPLSFNVAPQSSSAATTSTTALWNDYVANPDAHSHLPNCSYAGYRRGEVPIPDVPVVTSILDHGGVADGVTDNSEAFRLAIDAAYYAGGGAIEIPTGTYAVDDLIVLYRPGVVLRGAGMGQTTIKFTKPLLDVLGNPDPGGDSRWNWMGGLLWVGAREKSQFRRALDDHMIYNPVYPLYIDRGDGPKELWHYTEALTDVTSVDAEGDDTITVADAGGLRAGETILISYFNPEDLSLLHEIGKHPLMKDPSVDWGEWLVNNGTDIHGWYRLYWPVEIKSINGNEITLEQPLRLRTASEWQCQIHGMGDIVSEAGVEDLTIEGDAGASLAHNGGPGWNGMFFNQALNCWAKNVEVVNMENGFHISSCKGITLENTEVRGDRPMHHPYTTRQNSQDCYINNFVIDLTGVPAGGDPPVKHGINTEAFSAGNVWTRGTMSHGTFDSHRAVSYDYLRTDIDVANDAASGPGGSDKAGPYVGRRVVHWNVRVDSDMSPTDEGLYVYQPEALTFGALVGVQGAQMNTDAAWAMPRGDKNVIVLDHNTVPFIPNLYDAQFELRRDASSWAHLAYPITDFHPKGDIQLKASVNPGAGRTVDTVEYYANGSYIGSSSNGPEYSFNWNSVDYGYYQIQVKLIADNNAVTWSVPYDLTVGKRVKVEENSSLLVWNNAELETYTAESTFSGGSYVKVKGADAYVDLPFKGTRAKIYVRHKKQDQSSYAVYIDDMNNPVLGNTAATGENANQYLIYDTETLADGAHTLRIDTGDYPRMYIDFIELWITEDSVGGGNNAPVASDDSATMDLNSSVSIAVLINDSDADNDTLSISSYTQGSNGSVSQSGSNLVYTPNSNYSGSDSFTYVVSDGIASDTAKVSVSVISGGNNVPVANDDNTSTPRDTAIAIAVLSNDTDADGDSLFISGYTQPSYGGVSQSGNNIIYTPDSGYTGTDSFNYTVSDGDDTDTATVWVDVYDAGSQISFGNGGNPWPIPGLVEAENFDVGGNGVAYFDVSSVNSGDSSYRSGTDGSSVDLQVTNDPSGGVAHVHWFDNDEWLEYSVDVALSGTYTFSVRYATNESIAGYSLDLDGSEVIPSTALPNSGGWSVWATHELTGVSLTAGTHLLRFKRLGARFRFNWFELTLESTPGVEFAAWIRNEQFGLSGLDLTSSADPDNDGINNLLEYLFGTHPEQAGGTDLLNVGHDSDDFIFTFPLNDVASGIGYSVYYSHDLSSNWMQVNPADVRVQSVASGYSLQEARVEKGAETRVFFRVEASNPE